MFKIRQSVSILKRNISTTQWKKSPIRASINLAFGKYLLLTNTVSSGVLMFIGDIMQQEIEYQQKKLPERYDYGRLVRMLTVGVALGPLHHYFYSYLNVMFPARTISSVTKKILADQLIMSPACIAGFFYGMGILELKSLRQCTVELKDKCVQVYIMDWSVWPPTQFINFYFVPVKFQVFYVNAVTTLYNVFLSYIKHRDQSYLPAEPLVLVKSNGVEAVAAEKSLEGDEST